MPTQIASPTKIIDMPVPEARLIRNLFNNPAVRPDLVIITDRTPMPKRDEVIDPFREFGNVTRLDQVFPDPKADDIMAMVSEIKESPNTPASIIAIGGGSTLDSAKAVTMLLDNGGDLEEYLGPRATRKIEKHSTQLIAVPTTAGTGSEVTRFGVYTSRSGRKYTLASPFLQPDIALLAPALTLSMPPAITAATGFDALSHALESLWNKNATPESIRLSVDAAIHILTWIECAYDSACTGGTAGRQEMLTGACMAGAAFNLTGTASCHALSFVLSEEWHVPHGSACAFTLEDIFRANQTHPETNRRLGEIASAFFKTDNKSEGVPRLLQKIIDLKCKMKLPFTFRDLGITIDKSDIRRLFAKSLSDPKMSNNILPMTEDMIVNILELKQ